MKKIMNRKLGNDAVKTIREAMRGLTGSPAKQQAVRLAEIHDVNWQRIYEITEDLRPKRKTRADKGKRSFELVEGTDIWVAAQLVIVDSLDPDQALLTCQKRGLTNLPSLEYFQKLLREKGLGKKQRIMQKRPHRAFEAEFPGQIFQVDVTALKVRWENIKTRRILRIEGIDKNHPNLDDNMIRVWQIMGLDDFSRPRFLRYVCTTHITSLDIVRYLCEWFGKWGVPLMLYTDNGMEFRGYNDRAEKILNSILEMHGGYKHERHAPGNSQASGKVEVAHKWAEKMDKYVGLAITEGQTVDIDQLNIFADAICEYYNEAHVVRSTGQTPMQRWHSKRIVVRKLPQEILESALLADEFEVKLTPAMTVSHKGKTYKVPGIQPFVNYIDQKVTVVVPTEIDLILIKLPNETEFIEIEKVLAVADKAGEYKSHAENEGQQLTKRLKSSRKEEIKTIKSKSKQTGEIAPVPFLNVPVEIVADNVANFPHKEQIITAEEIAAVTPIPSSLLSERELNYWEALGMYAEQFDDIDEAKEFLKPMFGDGEVIAESEIEQAIKNREVVQQPTRRLRVV